MDDDAAVRDSLSILVEFVGLTGRAFASAGEVLKMRMILASRKARGDRDIA